MFQIVCLVMVSALIITSEAVTLRQLGQSARIRASLLANKMLDKEIPSMSEIKRKVLDTDIRLPQGIRNKIVKYL